MTMLDRVVIVASLAAVVLAGRESKVQCWKLQDLTEFCDYRDVCYSGADGLIIGTTTPTVTDADDDDGGGRDRRLQIVNEGGIHPYSHVAKQNYQNQGLMPWRAFVSGVVQDAAVLDDPANLWSGANTTLLMAFDADVPNIFHTSEKLLAGHGALWYLNQLGDAIQYDAVHMLRPARSLGAWEQQMIGILFEEAARAGALRYGDDAVPPPGRRLCFRRLVVPGTAIFFFGGPSQAAEVRGLVYRRALDGVVPVCDRPLITIIQRKTSRRIVNLDDAVELAVQALGVPFQIVYLEELTFAEQVRVMAESRVLVAVHGAGLSNVMFMQPNAVVLELFAYNYVYHLYHNIATAAGLFHVTYEAGRDETLYPGDIPPDHHSSYRCLGDGSCASSTKNSDLKLRIERFATTLAFALSLVGPCQ